MRIFALSFLALLTLSACSSNNSVYEDTSNTKINIQNMTIAQSTQTRDLLAIKDLGIGETAQANGATYTITDNYFAASGADCKKAKITRGKSSMTGFEARTTIERIHACYKDDIAFLPAPKIKQRY